MTIESPDDNSDDEKDRRVRQGRREARERICQILAACSDDSSANSATE